MIDLSDLPEHMQRRYAVIEAVREEGGHETWGRVLEAFAKEALALLKARYPDLAREEAVMEESLPVLVQADRAGAYDGEHLERLGEAVWRIVGALREQEGANDEQKGART